MLFRDDKIAAVHVMTNICVLTLPPLRISESGPRGGGGQVTLSSRICTRRHMFGSLISIWSQLK